MSNILRLLRTSTTATGRKIRTKRTDETFSDHPVLQLQQKIGNRATQRLLARQAAPDTSIGSELLTKPQVKDAITYYTVQPWRYTPEIIKKIQAEVGTMPTGKITEEDVQAVARRQQEMNDAGEKPVLVVDGKAGPRTLPSIFKIGLAKEDPLAAFGGAAKTILANPDKKTDEEITRQLVVELNKQLDAEKIPQITLDTTKDIAGRGAFDRETWELDISPLQFTDPKLRNMTDLTGTVYHEGRHAEQFYRIAQMLAGRKRTAKQIHAETNIRLDIAEIAVKNPLKPNTIEAVIAEGWHESIFGELGKARMEKNTEEIRKAFAAKRAAEKANQDDPTPENAAKEAEAKARYDKAVAEHDDLPHEFDAERLEDKIEKQL